MGDIWLSLKAGDKLGEMLGDNELENVRKYCGVSGDSPLLISFGIGAKVTERLGDGLAFGELLGDAEMHDGDRNVSGCDKSIVAVRFKTGFVNLVILDIGCGIGSDGTAGVDTGG
jgi:hypothetical protein